jgi:hypothetical protein
MPEYIYRCPKCGVEREVMHSMSEIDKPSEETQLETSCNPITCQDFNNSDLGLKFERIPQSCNFGKFNLLSQADKATMLKKRSHDHYEKEVKEVKHQMDKDIVNQVKKMAGQ